MLDLFLALGELVLGYLPGFYLQLKLFFESFDFLILLIVPFFTLLLKCAQLLLIFGDNLLGFFVCLGQLLFKGPLRHFYFFQKKFVRVVFDLHNFVGAGLQMLP